MTRQRILGCLIGLCVSLGAPFVAWAAECACANCGATACCRAYCRCVPGVEEKKVLCFECKSEDFCVPGPSVWCGRKCDAVPLPGDECACGGDCAIRWNIWKPRCAQVRTKRVLVVHEVTKEVPSHTWEVEYVCDACRESCAGLTPATTNAAGEIVPVSADMPLEELPAKIETPEPRGNWFTRLFAN